MIWHYIAYKWNLTMTIIPPSLALFTYQLFQKGTDWYTRITLEISVVTPYYEITWPLAQTRLTVQLGGILHVANADKLAAVRRGSAEFTVHFRFGVVYGFTGNEIPGFLCINVMILVLKHIIIYIYICVCLLWY